MRRPALLLVLLCVLTFFVGLGRPALTDADEAYYAEASREMVERGDWLTPYFNYEYRWQKPVLYYWLTSITYVVFGINEWSARLWSALAGLGLAFATYAAGRDQTRHDDVGWLAGAIVATSYGYFALARMALPDLPLAFFTTVAIGALLASGGHASTVASGGNASEDASLRRWIIAAVATGLGFLVKGPLALVVPGLVFAPVWWRERRTRRVRARDLACAAALFALVGLPWYVAMTMTHGSAYLDSFFIGDNLERFATDRFNEPRSPLFYVPILLGGLLPWTPFLIAAAWRPVRDLFKRRLVLTDTEWRLLLWAGMPFLFFSLSIGKQPRYILPVLPPVAILIARAIVHRIDASRTGDRGAQRDLRIATISVAVFFVVVALLLWNGRELFIAASPPLVWAAIGALLACAAMLAIVARPARLRHLPVVMPACAAVMFLSIQFGALSGRRPEAVEQMAALVQQHRTAGEPVGEHHVFVRNLIYYTGFRHEYLVSDERAVEFMRSNERVLMVVRDTELPKLEALAEVPMRRLGEVRYFNTANIKLPMLLTPSPEEHVSRVLLVSNR